MVCSTLFTQRTNVERHLQRFHPEHVPSAQLPLPVTTLVGSQLKATIASSLGADAWLLTPIFPLGDIQTPSLPTELPVPVTEGYLPTPALVPGQSAVVYDSAISAALDSLFASDEVSTIAPIRRVCSGGLNSVDLCI